MPTDIERLAVLIEANTKSYENAMRRLQGQTDRTLRGMESRFKVAGKKLDDSIGQAFGSSLRLLGALGVGFGLQRSIAAISQAAQEYVNLRNALRVAGLEGEDLERVQGALFVIAQKNGTALAPLTTLYSRAAQAQKELKASSAELLQFTDGVSLALRVAGSTSQEAKGALLQLSQAIGSGTVRAEEFNSVNEGARPILQAVAAGLKEAGGSVSALKTLVTDGKVSSEAFFRAFLAGVPMLEQQVSKAQGTVGQAMERMQNAFVMFIGKLDETTKVSANAADNINGVASAIEKLPDFIAAAAKGLDSLQGKLQQFGSLPIWDKINKFFTLEGKIQVYDPRTRTYGGPERLPGYVTTPPGFAQPGMGSSRIPEFGLSPAGRAPAPGAINPVSLKSFPVSGKGGKGNTVGVDSFERALAAAQKRVEVLNAETTAIGLGTVAREKAKLVAELETAAKAENSAAGMKNTEVTAAQRLKIDEAANSMERAASRNELLTRSFEAQQDAIRFAGDQTIDVINALSGTAEQRAEALRSVVNSLIQALIRASLLGEGPLAGLLGTKSATGGVGGLFGALFGGFRAGGGPVDAGKAYVVGEKRPEIFVPSTAGRIVPSVGSGSPGVSVVMHNDFRGADPGAVAGIGASLAKLQRELPLTIKKTVQGLTATAPGVLR